MRWSVSKGFKFGPFRLTVSKSGLTASVGVPGARVSLNTQGKARVRVGKKGFAWTKEKKILPGIDPAKLIE